MTIEQTVEIPENRRITFDLPFSFPVGMAKVALVVFPEVKSTPASPESSADSPAQAGSLSRSSPQEELPKVTRAQRAQWAEERKNDPVWQVLDQPLEHDWSWLPEGLTSETFLVKDVRDIIIKNKYGL
jgi:hypothetical protein